MCGPKGLEGITSYNKAKIPIHNYIKATKKITDKIFEYIKSNDEGGFDDKSVEKSDLLFLFLRPVDSILDEEKFEPVEEALVNTCTYVDIHYTYILQTWDNQMIMIMTVKMIRILNFKTMGLEMGTKFANC